MEATAAEQLLIEIITAGTPYEAAKRITPSSTWEELGMDSLDYIEMINEVRDKVGPISDKEASQLETVGALVDFFSKRVVG